MGGGAMGKRMLSGWQGPKARRGVGNGRWGGWTEGRGDGEGWIATGGWRQGGGIWKGATGRERWGGSNRDGKRLAMERGTR